MFHLGFAIIATTVLSLINWYSFRRFLKRIELLRPYQTALKWAMVAMSLCEALYFLLLRVDNLNLLLYTLFSSLIGVSFMIFCVALIYDLAHIPYAKIPHNHSRRLFVKMVFDVTMLLIVASYMLKGFMNGIKKPAVREVDIEIEGLKEEISIVQISDVHIGKALGKAFMDDLVEQINRLNADIVVITGDLVDMPVDKIGDKLDSLRNIESRYGAFFVPGNHEYFYGVNTIMEYIEFLGVNVLCNRSLVVADTINLAGVADMMGKRFDFVPPDLGAALKQARPNLPTVLLSHQPKIVKELKGNENIDLILSGHTHGGQIFPFGLLVLLDQPYLSGLYQHSKKTQIFVSNGAGYWGPPVRLFAPSELVRITLRTKA